MGLVQKCGGKGTVFPRQRTTRVRISLIFIDSSLELEITQFAFQIQKADHRNGRQNDNESDDMKSASQREHDPVAEAVVQQIAHQLSEGDSAHGAAEAYQPGD